MGRGEEGGSAVAGILEAAAMVVAAVLGSWRGLALAVGFVAVESSAEGFTYRPREAVERWWPVGWL